jgi:uncharacterized protein YbjT (DUF2867 family)
MSESSIGEDDQTVLVIGATGTQGGFVARALLERRVRVRALTRDPQSAASRSLALAGAQVAQGDLDDSTSLVAALVGVDSIFSVQDVLSAGDDGEARQGAALIDVAVQTGIRHFVQSSAGGVDRFPDRPGNSGKSRVEAHLQASGLSYTIIAPTSFMSNWDFPFFRPMILEGRLALPLSPDVVLQQVAPVDIGKLAALALTDTAAWTGRRIELAGDARAIGDIAVALGESLGRPVAYEQITFDEFTRTHGDFFAGLYRWYAEHGYRADIPTLRRQLPDLSDFNAYLHHRGSFADAPSGT